MRVSRTCGRRRNFRQSVGDRARLGIFEPAGAESLPIYEIVATATLLPPLFYVLCESYYDDGPGREHRQLTAIKIEITSGGTTTSVDE